MLYALSTGHKIGLAATGAAFILFALISSFVLPRMNGNFPGRGLKPYLAVCVCFFAAMITAVLVFDREKKPAEAAPPAATSTVPAGPAATGDPAAGKALFLGSAGCAACHTFKPAGATGKVGPDLDDLTTDAAGAKQPLVAFVHESIVDPDAYIAPGFTKGIMPGTFASTLKPAQIDDLVAFLTKS
jgi:mono/diheme cytochrome c family protein